jgi:hypothetical protein
MCVRVRAGVGVVFPIYIYHEATNVVVLCACRLYAAIGHLHGDGDGGV